MCRANPISKAAAGGYLPANVSGQNKTRVRRVAAATPIRARRMTPIQTKRVARCRSAMSPHDSMPCSMKTTEGTKYFTKDEIYRNRWARLATSRNYAGLDFNQHVAVFESSADTRRPSRWDSARPRRSLDPTPSRATGIQPCRLRSFPAPAGRRGAGRRCPWRCRCRSRWRRRWSLRRREILWLRQRAGVRIAMVSFVKFGMA